MRGGARHVRDLVLHVLYVPRASSIDLSAVLACRQRRETGGADWTRDSSGLPRRFYAKPND